MAKQLKMETQNDELLKEANKIENKTLVTTVQMNAPLRNEIDKLLFELKIAGYRNIKLKEFVSAAIKLFFKEIKGKDIKEKYKIIKELNEE